MTERRAGVLLVGGGVASARCARTLRRAGYDGPILLVGEEPTPPYNRPPLTKELLRDEVSVELLQAEPSGWYDRRGVELLTGVAAVEIDPARRQIGLSDGTYVRYDRCLLATGARPRRPPIPGAEQARVMRTLDDALGLRAAAPEGRVVIVGGGFIGIEVAGSLAARGVPVALLELAPMLWGGSLGPELSGWAASVLEGLGVEVRLSTAATRLAMDAAWVGEERLPAGVVLAAVGVAPRDELAAAAGILCRDGILTDASHATSAPGIWAAGDVARVDGIRVEHWHAAREGGERAALAMLGEPLPARRAPWIFSELGGQQLGGHQLDVVGWAPTWDAVRRIGDDDRFVLAYLVRDRVVQLAIVDGALRVEEARALVERSPALDELELRF